MKYFDFALAPNPRRVDLFMFEKGLDIETIEINLRAGGQFEPGFLALNPQATVPCLQLDDGSVITETMAICRYLEAVYPRPCLFGTTPRSRSANRTRCAPDGAPRADRAPRRSSNAPRRVGRDTHRD